jgi:hypothetical protein
VGENLIEKTNGRSSSGLCGERQREIESDGVDGFSLEGFCLRGWIMDWSQVARGLLSGGGGGVR